MEKIFNSEWLVHSLKSVTACVLGILLANFIGEPNALWIVVTIIVIMCAQPYVGGVIQKSIWRILGTLIGCSFATITLVSFEVTPVSILLTIVTSVFIFSYLAAAQENMMYAATLGATTTTIIMMGQIPTLTLATHRFLEISMGIGIAALVSQFIFPIHASTHLKKIQAQTIMKLGEYYKMLFASTPLSGIPNYLEAEENIAKSLLKQRQLAKESKIEPFRHSFSILQFMQLLYCERDILRAITFMHQAFCHFSNERKFIDVKFKEFNEAVIKVFDDLSKKINEEKSTLPINIPSCEDLKTIFNEVISHASEEELLYVNGYLFSAECMLLSLNKIAHLNDEQLSQGQRLV